MKPSFDFDVACVLSTGNRTYQEDAVIADFPSGSDTGIVVLADGMGGHAAGDVASKIVVEEVSKKLTINRGDQNNFEQKIGSILIEAAGAANGCLREHTKAFPETRGMGTTLLAPVIIRRNLYWISIGDSPLYLFRKNELTQLNEDHSMATQIDFMVNYGLISSHDAKRHPDRNVLTSVLNGEQIAKVDCRKEPLALKDGDVLIAASDGLQFLNNDQIATVLRENRLQTSDQIADELLSNLAQLNDPNLDNVSFSIVKLENAAFVKDDMASDETGGGHRAG